jgi:hypothetical protein
MKIRTANKLGITVSVLLLAASQVSPVQAADNYYSGQAYAQPENAPMTQQPQYVQEYGAPVYGNSGYDQRYYGGRRDYGRNSNPWGDNGPSFSGPWDSGRGGNSMPWDSGRGGRGGNNMPWESGRGGRNMPWESGRGGHGGNNMPWN